MSVQPASNSSNDTPKRTRRERMMPVSNGDQKHAMPQHGHDPDERARRFLMFILAALVTALALIGVFYPGAGSILDRIVPLLTMVVGYFFGQHARKTRI